MGETLFIGIDLGGTDIKGGLVATDGRVVYETKIPTEADLGPDHVMDRMAELVHRLVAHTDLPVSGVGIGVPGQVLVDEGVLVEAPNLRGMDSIPIAREMERRLSLPVILDNDANVAALGEFAFGAGRGTQQMMMVTLGTGVGGGLILDGRIYRGARGGAGEFGHTVVEADGEVCGCGRQGCVEAYVGTMGLLNSVERRLKMKGTSSLSAIPVEERQPRDISEAADAGDEMAQTVLASAGHMLGVALGSVANLLNLEKIVVGGGVAAAGERILGPARVALSETALKVSLDSVEIVAAQLGNAAGLAGAARLAMMAFEKPDNKQ